MHWHGVMPAITTPFDEGLGVDPRQMRQHGFAAADLVGQVLVAACLARLALQAFDLRAELAHDVGETS